ncbi:alpha/beta fold hydrolase [Streptosporangium sp. NPDC020145]|uniref:alpha/beta fold hydrolase n=1 Tax=Streptosporangium sp. NPDC020145 TaxID=3154694 RepID=UPI003424F025
MTSAEERYRKRRVGVDGLEMAYVEEGEGDPIVFLHGNPTSSYVWRNVIPYLAGKGRCIAPDLIGMGDSAKLPAGGPGSYRFVEHRRYLDAFLQALGVRERVVLVLRGLSEAEMAVYRRPYTEPGESRRPTLTWPREVPVAGEPRDVHDVITRYAEWLAESSVPKLFIEAVPGTMFETHRAVARSWPNQAHITITGGHMVQEDAPDQIGAAIVSWLRDLS